LTLQARRWLRGNVVAVVLHWITSGGSAQSELLALWITPGVHTFGILPKLTRQRLPLSPLDQFCQILAQI